MSLRSTDSDANLVIPFTLPRELVPLPTKVHGAVIHGSLRALAKRGLGDRHAHLVDPRHRDAVKAVSSATGWLPLEVGLAHYDACERLGLPRRVIEEIGAESGLHVNDTILSVITRLTRASGLTPWFALEHANTFAARTWNGSSFAVWKLGPKEARVEWIQQPAARIPYFRAGLVGFLGALFGLFAQSIYVKETGGRIRPDETEIALRVSWV